METAQLDVLAHFPEDTTAPLAASLPGLRFVQVPTQGPVDPGVRGEALLTFAWGSSNIASLLDRGVRWIHTIGTGVDSFPLDQLDGQLLTCSRGVSAVPISEWVLAMMLAFEKQLPASWVREPPERWNLAKLGTLQGKTLGLVGFGGIARAVAQRALAFGMHVLAHRRTGAASGMPGVEVVRDLPTLAARADHLVVAASATAATRHLVDAALFERAKHGVHLVNIARGSLVDQEALRAALDAGRVARASLDVCEPEPLPAGHWLYTHPQVRLSPHLSWSMPDAIPQLFESFVRNARRYLGGEPLEGVVDLEQGY